MLARTYRVPSRLTCLSLLLVLSACAAPQGEPASATKSQPAAIGATGSRIEPAGEAATAPTVADPPGVTAMRIEPTLAPPNLNEMTAGESAVSKPAAGVPEASNLKSAGDPTITGTYESASAEDLPAPAIDLPDFGPAPDFLSDTTWLNTTAPASLAALRGKVVLVEFWTFDCINCQHVIPWVRDMHRKYTGDEFAVVSIHYPEFADERVVDNVRAATKRLDVPYPVAIDNDGRMWRAYDQRYWPALYLLDKQGHIRYRQFGEGAYDTSEEAIRALMAQPDPAG